MPSFRHCALLGGCLAAALALPMVDAASAAPVDEFVTFRFNDGSSRAEQIAVMHKLDGVVAPLNGFISREYYLDTASGQWLDHLAWASPEAADASQKVMQRPDVAAIFAKFSGTVVTRYEKVK